jgi:hypothetical protein
VKLLIKRYFSASSSQNGARVVMLISEVDNTNAVRKDEEKHHVIAKKINSQGNLKHICIHNIRALKHMK